MKTDQKIGGLFGDDREAIRASIEEDIQKLLRTPRRLSRSEHPKTSKLAAAQIEDALPHLHREVLELVRQHPLLTANELAAINDDRDVRRIGRRLSELVELERLARGDPRPCKITGRKAYTWRALD